MEGIGVARTMYFWLQMRRSGEVPCNEDFSVGGFQGVGCCK